MNTGKEKMEMEKYKKIENGKRICFIFMFFMILLFFLCYPKRIFAADSVDESYITALEMKDVKDGTAPFDENDKAGNDSNDHNGIVRTFDTINYTLKYTTAIKNSNIQGIDSANVMVEFGLPCDPKEATFNKDTMTWLLEGKIIYTYSDGTEKDSWDQDKTVVSQRLAGKRRLVNNESGNSVPETGYAPTNDAANHPGRSKKGIGRAV